MQCGTESCTTSSVRLCARTISWLLAPQQFPKIEKYIFFSPPGQALNVGHILKVIPPRSMRSSTCLISAEKPPYATRSRPAMGQLKRAPYLTLAFINVHTHTHRRYKLSSLWALSKTVPRLSPLITALSEAKPH